MTSESTSICILVTDTFELNNTPQIKPSSYFVGFVVWLWSAAMNCKGKSETCRDGLLSQTQDIAHVSFVNESLINHIPGYRTPELSGESGEFPPVRQVRIQCCKFQSRMNRGRHYMYTPTFIFLHEHRHRVSFKRFPLVSACALLPKFQQMDRFEARQCLSYSRCEHRHRINQVGIFHQYHLQYNTGS